MFKRKIYNYIKRIRGHYNHLYDNSIKINRCWHGNSYGGFYIAPEYINSKSIIYSFGIGDDISFDISLISKYNCKVFAFDPTPKSIKWINENSNTLPRNFHFNSYGISDKSSNVDFFLPKNLNHMSGSMINQSNVNTHEKVNVQMKSLLDICNELGHNTIDILKMDIEGAEYLVFDSLIYNYPKINQITVEFHDRFFNNGLELTKNAINKLYNQGFLIFGISDSHEEISFIHKSLIS